MMRLLTTMGAMLAIAALTACDPSNDTETRTFRLEHITPANAVALVKPHLNADATVMGTEDPPTVVVSASAERLEQITDLLSRYDVPGPDVQLRFQLIEADGFTETDPAIADVEAALRELFRFRGYRLVSEAMLTVSQYSDARQRLLGFDNVPLYLATDVGRISAMDGSSSVELEVSLAEPNGEILSTSVIVPGGQTVILGNARPFENRGALILVVRPEIQ